MAKTTRQTRETLREDLRANTLAEFVEIVAKRSPPLWIFRGQSRISDPLLPQLLRPGVVARSSDLETFERELLDEFQREAWPYLEQVAPELTVWEWLAIAQHHGLPTRLLDWSLNAGAALFFSVEAPQTDEDSVVYAYRHAAQRRRPRMPSAIREVCVYQPPHIAGRFISQRGCFTVHPADFDQRRRWNGDLVRLTIPRECRDDFREELRTLGIDRASLFPGLDGVVQSIRARWGSRADRRAERTAARYTRPRHTASG